MPWEGSEPTFQLGNQAGYTPFRGWAASVNLKMQRSKVLAVVAALVAAATAAVVFAGGASAASWHVYEGDMFAGHAYGLQVPAGAESVEFILDGVEAAAGDIGVYAPDGSRVGFYALSASLTAASVANPDEGQYVVYVYEVVDGALSVRVNSEDAPALKLDEVPLAREETKIGTFPQGSLDQVITSDLERAPVFVTLLYEGSATGLDATVSSEKGDVVTIVDETATAFSPGVWTSMKGERLFDAANLDGAKYTVEVHADRFEGTMVLTTLALDLPMPGVVAPAPTPTWTKPARAPVAPVPAASEATFALEPQEAVAFTAPAGKLLLLDPEALAEKAAEESEDDANASHDHEARDAYALISIYTPDDALLTVVELSRAEPTVEVELPVAGEYVAYTRFATSDVVLAKIDGLALAPAVRQLAIERETMEVAVGAMLGEASGTDVELTHVPLELYLGFVDGVGALARVELSHEEGIVATAEQPLLVPGGAMPLGWSFTDYGAYASGMHTLTSDGAFEGTLQLAYAWYDRAADVTEEGAHEHDGHEHESEDHDDGEATPAAAPTLVPALDLLDLI